MRSAPSLVAESDLGDALDIGSHGHVRSADKPAALPLVWVLTCHREGDNVQMIGLAEALGWPFEVKRIVYKRLELVPNLLFQTTLAGMDQRRSSRLEPPWPDLLIFAFRANENIARWIRARAGGRTKFVVVGRPWSPLREFDLIVTTPQLCLPKRQNVLHNALPLHRVTPERLAASAQEWAPRFAHLRRPYLAVLVGGTSGPYVFGRQAARRLGREVSALSRRLGGSVLVTTSARTSAAATRALWHAIDGPAYRHRWRSDGQPNPYFAFLALADRIVVTAESISMVTEACAAGKPVFMFDFGGGPVAMRPSQSWRQWLDPYPETWAYALYMSLPRGRLNRTRDLRLVYPAILASGRARWLGDQGRFSAGAPDPSNVTQAVARIRALFADRHLQAETGSRRTGGAQASGPMQEANVHGREYLVPS
jgi:mitochondrial fission protein ELM1